MPVEKSAGAVIFRRENNKIFYLLLHYPGASHRSKKDYWDFPKGHIEKGEKVISPPLNFTKNTTNCYQCAHQVQVIDNNLENR